jgi:hypothetical protein
MAVRVQCPICGKTFTINGTASARRTICPWCAGSRAAAAEARAAAPEPAPVGSAPAPDWALNAAQPMKVLAPQPAAAPPALPSSILTPITPPPPSTAALKPVAPPPAPVPPPLPREAEAPPSASRRGLLLGVIAGGLLLLVGSTVLAIALASRTDRRKNHQPVAQKQDSGSAEYQEGQQQFDNRRRDDDTPRVEDRLPRDNDKQQPRDDKQRNNDFRPPPQIDDRKQEPVSADRSTLPRELQEEVNRAIDKGVAFLKKTQLLNGTWENNHQVGMAALPGLTLLECGVKADDPAVQKAAKYVREHAMKQNHSATYECSLALLFLDRLGDPKDKPLIRSLALRIVAGQQSDGGWTYELPQLSTKEERPLMEFLEKTRPERKMDLMVRNKGDKLDSSIKSDERKSLDGYYEALDAKKPTKGGGNLKEFDNDAKKPKPISQEEAKKALDKLPLQVKNAPAVIEPAKVPPSKPMQRASDNSNTQFAMLALWAARRHDVPLERSLDAVGRRFKDSQSDQGTWGYHAAKFAGGTPAMTGAGLLGLAVGHGSATDPDRKFKVKDPQIDKGLKALGQHVGKPLGKAAIEQKKNNKGRIVLKRQNAPINLYFLWTVERVGVLYGIHELDGKDWYLWGVELLLPVQADEGSWAQGGYPGPTKHCDTSFALLFLKRANLAKDLTQRLDFVVEGKPTR